MRMCLCLIVPLDARALWEYWDGSRDIPLYPASVNSPGFPLSVYSVPLWFGFLWFFLLPATQPKDFAIQGRKLTICAVSATAADLSYGQIKNQ